VGRKRRLNLESAWAFLEPLGWPFDYRLLRDAAPPRLLVILGASGAGKSSFLRAYQDVVVFLPSIVLPFRHSSSCP
jgi:hypothetical protein